MVTKAQAIAATHGAEFHFGCCARSVGPRGGVTESITRVRTSGKCKTWVTRPDAFALPVKHGLYRSTVINEATADSWHVPQDCPLALWPEASAFVVAVASLFRDTPHVLVRAPRADEPQGAWAIIVAPAPLTIDELLAHDAPLARLLALTHVTRTRDTFGDDGRVFNRFCVAPRAGVRREAFHA